MEVLFINPEYNRMDLTVSVFKGNLTAWESSCVQENEGCERMEFSLTQRELGMMPGNPVNKGTWEKLFLPMPHCHAS